MQTKLSVTGVGTDANTRPLFPSVRTIQVDGDGATTFRVLGKLTAAAPFMELVAPGTADIIQDLPTVPYIQLEVTAGLGTVTAYVA